MDNRKPDPYSQGLAKGHTTDQMCDLFSTTIEGNASQKTKPIGGKKPRKNVPPKTDTTARSTGGK